MNKEIQIYKNGHLQETLQLGNGTYRLGRDAGSDIVLADGAVSKTHAILTIDSDSFLIKDSGSANGIFLEGKKVTEHRFNNSLEIEIRPFTIKTADSDQEADETGKKSGGAADSIRKFSINNIKISILVIFGITMLLTVFIGYIPLQKQTTAIARQEMLKSGILLARYLGEMNRPFLETGQNTQVRTSPVRIEDGVIYAFVVDDQGRIIAPHEKQGDFVDWPGLSNAFAGAKLIIEDGRQNEKIIFYPVVQQNKTIGAAILGFAWQQSAGQQASGLGLLVFFLLAILFVIGFIVSHMLAKAFLHPLKSLYEEVEIAIKKGGAALEYHAPYEELDNLKRAFDRLLMRKAPESRSVSPATPPSMPGGGISRSPSAEKSPLQDTTGFPSPATASIDIIINALTAPWCIIDRENYTLQRFSDNFTPGFGTTECRQGMHIIEALETDIIPGVSQMIDSDDQGELPVAHAGKTYSLRRIISSDAAEKNNVILVFEDKVE